MELHLIHTQYTSLALALFLLRLLLVRLQLFEMLYLVIADADALDLSIVYGLYQRLPGAQTGLFGLGGRMDKVEVEVLKVSNPVESLGEALFGAIVSFAAWRDFGGEEELGAREFGGDEGGSCRFFVSVGNGGVDLDARV